MRWSLAILLLGGCGGDETPTSGVCDDLCRELVQTCGYAAYPSLDSCRQGCAWYKSEGVDVDAEYACIEAAGCDTFLILECEHAHGLDS